MKRPALLIPLAAALALSGCIQIMDITNPTAPTDASIDAPVLPPVSALPPAEYVAVRLVDGSPGLALWCEERGDCIGAARILCENRQSIRSEFDIDRTAPGAAQYFSLSADAAHRLTVSCPVSS